uniref:Lipocalin-like domain-containing protein n=1 Tax=Candidatus Kentrum sp. DK TaxID=2126562 RepID=A0A450TKG6_9GAMM|nr:MAG: hypothetical protein BECKDK2373B_GA0170837_12062 [Candidatus Kentron sp. DK]
MRSIKRELMINIIVSLASICVVILFQNAWNKWFVPSYKEFLYEDVDISGKWEANLKYRSGDENRIEYNFTQTGHNITGYAYSLDGSNKGQKWEFEGDFFNLIAAVTYSSEGDRHLDRGSASLQLTENGNKLVGHIIYYENKSNSLWSVVAELTRSSGK